MPVPILFVAPPELVVIPGTYVYAVPDVDEDLFFYNGWWWRPWEGGWYRSRRHDSGWVHYYREPPFYSRVPSHWRNDYRDHRWEGREWNHQRIPHQQVQKNWKGWEKNRRWEKEQSWGVQGMKPVNRPLESRHPSRDVRPPPDRPRQPRESRPEQARPQRREDPRPQQAQPQRREDPRPEQARPRQQEQPQPREVQPQRPQPQRGDAPKPSRPRHEKPERGDEENRGRR